MTSHDATLNLIDLGHLVYESTSTSIYRVPDEENKLGGSTGAVAIKTLSTKQSDPAHISRLYDEYIISRHLSKCHFTRSALRHIDIKQEKLYAIYLEWVPGLSLREFLEARSASMNVMDMVRVAYEISAALSEIHEKGVIHNNFSADNIIVSEGETGFSVKIIDLGTASLQGWSKRSDLFSLGWLLYQLFSGRNPIAESGSDVSDVRSIDGDKSSKRIAKRKRKIPPLHELRDGVLSEGVPKSISALVSCLMDSGSATIRYQTAGEVKEDLKQMVQNPDRFLFDCEGDIVAGNLTFPKHRLYGRSKQVSTLMDAYERAVSSGGSSELVVISGRSGSGKSSLAQHVRGPVELKGGYFVSGKFDQLQQTEPLSAVVAAFADFCEQVDRGKTDDLHRVRMDVKEELGSDADVLMALIPGLSKILGFQQSKPLIGGGVEGLNRVKVLLRAFARTIASHSHPIVILIDDLQWADKSSLDLIKMLVTDAESKSILFIGCYRDNEVSYSDELMVQLREIERKNAPLTKIELGNIGDEDVTEFLSDSLRMPKSLVRPLADFVCCKTSNCKTNGNPLLVINFLKSLLDDGYLRFSSDSCTWEWDTAAVEAALVPIDASEYLASKILRVPADVREALILAACLGHHCEKSILHILQGTGTDAQAGHDRMHGILNILQKDVCLEDLLDVATNLGFMNKMGSRYEFDHDEIQSALYELIPDCKRTKLHCWIGYRLWKSATPDELEEVLFVAVSQLSRGSVLIDDEEEKVAVAKLDLRAGYKAMSLSAYAFAADYLKAGVVVLGSTQWDDHYDLSLRLHEALAESEYCTGNHDGAMAALDQVLTNGATFDDKLPAFSTLIKTLGATRRVDQAIAHGFTVLSQLGVFLPTSTDECVSSLLPEWIQLRDMLEGYTDDSLMTLKNMEDDRQLIAMSFLNTMAWHSYASMPALFPLIAMRMVKISLLYGVCELSAYGFAAYGVSLCASFDQVDTGYNFGKLALSLADRFESTSCLPRISVGIYCCINPWTDHLRLSLDPLLHAYEVGMRLGDIEYAMLNALAYIQIGWQYGVKLTLLETRINWFRRRMLEYNQDMILIGMLPYCQAVLNLMGDCTDPMKLTGKVMDQDKLLAKMRGVKFSAAECLIYVLSMRIACIYGDYRRAAEFADLSREIETKIYSAVEVCTHAFFDGLIALTLAHTATEEEEEKALRRRADGAISKMKNWTDHAPMNYGHKLKLLEAERAFLERQEGRATSLFDAAIGTARENGFLPDEALACERAAMFHAKTGDDSRASQYYNDAHELYLRWGAQGKANHIRCSSLSLILPSD